MLVVNNMDMNFFKIKMKNAIFNSQEQDFETALVLKTNFQSLLTDKNCQSHIIDPVKGELNMVNEISILGTKEKII